MKFKTFMNDEDGMSAKDYLMIVFSGIYVIEQLIVFTLSLLHMLPADTKEVVEMLNPVVVTIIGGVFTVNVSETIRKMVKDKREYQSYSVPVEPVDEQKEEALI